MAHLVWGCSSNEGEIFGETAYLAAEALSQPEWASFWLRGWVPRSWLPRVPNRLARTAWALGFTGSFEPAEGERWVFLAGDASGGPDTVDPELRQVGLGLAHFDEQGLEQWGSLSMALASKEPQKG